MDIVYVLRLRGGRYYIGYSRHHNERIEAHMNGHGAEWTKVYPVEEVECLYNGNTQTEREITLKYMAKYGVHKVRGGCWSQVNIQHLPRDLVDAYSHQCSSCGYYGHSMDYCSANQSRDSNSMDEEPYQSSEEPDSDSYDNEFCVRCGRNNHSYNNCKASYTRDRHFIGRDDCCARCGRFNHWSQQCRANFDNWGNRL